MSKNELTVNTNQGYMNLANGGINGDFLEELSGLDNEFERIKIPAGGGTMFEFPSSNPDELDMIKEFSAVILYHHPMYVFYSSKFNGSNNPPDCLSIDGITGVGVPGGKCINCPKNKFGSGENGSKACKNKHQMYLLREGEIFPVILSLPTSSNREFSRYIKRLLSRGKKSDSVVTKFSLKKAVNKTGISYSQVQFSVARELDTKEIELIKNYSEQVKSYAHNKSNLQKVDMTTGEIIDSEESV
ncbi:MAG: hypothetical protein IKE41_01610 [Clostridia bacterium]|nr:hypothetical protein [Clostridia bacterium]MBR2734914.1 hypothetical protein [Clostridia bacterium]